MRTTFVVIAHRAGARLFTIDGDERTLRLVAELENPRARQKNVELDTDSPGEAFASAGRGGGHPMNTAESAHERAASDFARELAAILSARRADRHFDDLVLVAEPGFLGMLRNALDHPTTACVRRTLHKNLAHEKAHDLVGFLSPIIDVRLPPRR